MVDRFLEVIYNWIIVKFKHQKNNNGKKIELDGDDLMNHAFGCENKKPKIKINSLKTSLDKTEQRGFMYLYKGKIWYTEL